MRPFLIALSYIGAALMVLAVTLPASANTPLPVAPPSNAAMNAEVSGLEQCDPAGIAAENLDSMAISTNTLAALAYAVETRTNWGENTMNGVTYNQLMLVRSLFSFTARRGSTVAYVSLHEGVVLCELGYRLLERDVLDGRAL